MEQKKYDVLIIGGGPAGIFATSLAHIKGLKPLLIEANDYLGGQPLMIYSQKMIEDYPGYTKIKAYQLVDQLINQLKNTRAPYLLKTKIASYIEKTSEFVVDLSNGEQVIVKAIIIATGPGMFTPNHLQITNNNQANVQYGVEDIQTYQNKDIIILGGGDSAVDWANELSSISKSATIIHRRNEFRANGSNVTRLRENKVNVLLDYEIIEINNQVLVCRKNNKEELVKLKFDYVIVQYGQTIDTSAFKIFSGLKITDAKRIPVDSSQMTNLPNIYAIGNVCIYDGKPSSIICAHGEAAVAVRHILNKVRPYETITKK